MKAKPVATANQSFSFNQRPSLWTEATWLVGAIPVHGYFLAIDALSAGAVDPFVLIAYSLEADWANYQDALQSLLDSFFIGEASMYTPGPVTQLATQIESKAPSDAQAVAVKVSQAVAARESRILAGYQDADAAVQDKAWRRFYQLIWKDSYSRLDLVAKQIAQVFSEERVLRERQPVELLSFIQDFTAETYSDLSDIRVPVDAINRESGDCDGRGLVFMILLEHLGFSSILLVSSAYAHSMVGLDHQAAGIKDGGFTFPVDGKNWMVAETMAKVKLGQINKDMSDPAKWLGFDLHFVP